MARTETTRVVGVVVFFRAEGACTTVDFVCVCRDDHPVSEIVSEMDTA